MKQFELRHTLGLATAIATAGSWLCFASVFAPFCVVEFRDHIAARGKNTSAKKIGSLESDSR